MRILILLIALMAVGSALANDSNFDNEAVIITCPLDGGHCTAVVPYPVFLDTMSLIDAVADCGTEFQSVGSGRCVAFYAGCYVAAGVYPLPVAGRVDITYYQVPIGQTIGELHAVGATAIFSSDAWEVRVLKDGGTQRTFHNGDFTTVVVGAAVGAMPIMKIFSQGMITGCVASSPLIINHITLNMVNVQFSSLQMGVPQTLKCTDDKGHELKITLQFETTYN